MKCPECGSDLEFSSYSYIWICECCGWESEVDEESRDLDPEYVPEGED